MAISDEKKDEIVARLADRGIRSRQIHRDDGEIIRDMITEATEIMMEVYAIGYDDGWNANRESRGM